MDSQQQPTAPADDRKAAQERLVRLIDARTAVVVVIGLGTAGTSMMASVLAAGFEAHGFDRSADAVARFSAHAAGWEAPKGRAWSAGTDESVLARADVVLIAVRALVRQDWSVNLEPLKSVANTLSNHPRGQRLVLIESTLPPGTTRTFAEEWMGLGPNSNVFVANCPERLQAGGSAWTLRNTPHLVGGIDAAATTTASAFLSTLCDTVVPVSQPEVAEVSKLLENAFLAVGISFIGEMTRLSHALGISAEEVANAAATKPFGYYAFYPGPGIGGHCIPNDLQILRRAIRDLGLNAPMLDGTSAAAADLPKTLVDYLGNLLIEHGKNFTGLRVLIIGVGFKIGSRDTTDTPARDVVRYLRNLDAIPVYLDSGVPRFIVDGEAVASVSVAQLKPGMFEAGIVHSGDSVVTGEQLTAAVKILLDAGGGRLISGGLPGAARL